MLVKVNFYIYTYINIKNEVRTVMGEGALDRQRSEGIRTE